MKDIQPEGTAPQPLADFIPPTSPYRKIYRIKPMMGVEMADYSKPKAATEPVNNQVDNRIVLGDCLEEMKHMPDNSVDCIVTDPPFFMPAAHYASRVHWQRNYGDLTPLKVFWNEVTKELRRVLKDDGHLFVFSNCDSYPVFYEPTYNHFDKVKSIVWNKGKVGLGRIFRNQHELIIWARNKDCKYNNDHKLRADVLTYPATPSAKRSHPVEKPTAMLKDLIAPTTFENDIVFDPFAGSGTTLLAAKERGRDYLGIEISPTYIEAIQLRMAQEALL